MFFLIIFVIGTLEFILLKSPIKEVTPNHNNIEKANTVIVSLIFLFNGLFVIISINTNKNWPPSKAGKGKLLIKAKLTDNDAANPTNAILEIPAKSAPVLTTAIDKY